MVMEAVLLYCNSQFSKEGMEAVPLMEKVEVTVAITEAWGNLLRV
jgi:hypothetical protein